MEKTLNQVGYQGRLVPLEYLVIHPITPIAPGTVEPLTRATMVDSPMSQDLEISQVMLGLVLVQQIIMMGSLGHMEPQLYQTQPQILGTPTLVPRQVQLGEIRYQKMNLSLVCRRMAILQVQMVSVRQVLPQ